MNPRSLARLRTVTERLERVRRAEWMDADRTADLARRERDATLRTMSETARALFDPGVRSAHEQAGIADLVARARIDVVRAEDQLVAKERTRDDRRRDAEAARRDVKSLDRARERIEEELRRERDRQEQRNADDRAGARRLP